MAQVTPPSAAVFVAKYPEFAALSSDVCDLYLAEAAQEFDSVLFAGAKGTAACMAQAAHLLALSPYGRDMQLVSKEGSTVYEGRVKAAKIRATCGYRP